MGLLRQVAASHGILGTRNRPRPAARCCGRIGPSADLGGNGSVRSATRPMKARGNVSDGLMLGAIWLWFAWCCGLVGIVVAAKRGWMTQPTLPASAIADRFALRYKLGLWFGVVPFLGFIGATALLYLFPSSATPFYMAGAVLCFHCVFLYVAVLYRCPRCGTQPTSSTPGTTGILLRPKRCAKCGATLLASGRRRQD